MHGPEVGFLKNQLKDDLRRLLPFHTRVTVECAICFMSLLLNRRAEFEKFFWDRLSRCFEHVNEGTGLGFIMLGEESNGQAFFSRSSCPARIVSMGFEMLREVMEGRRRTGLCGAHNPQQSRGMCN